MGMYTAISLGVELNIEQNDPVSELLRCMTGQIELVGELPDHPLFEQDRWRALLCCDSYYFNYQTSFELRWDNISNNYYLSGVSNLKNYGGEIDLFLDWLNPYIHASSSGFIGWTMYEEDWWPTILMRRRLIRDGGQPDIQKVKVEELLELALTGDELVESLLPGASHCVLNIDALNEFLDSTTALKRRLT